MWKQRHFILNIQKLEAGRLTVLGKHDIQQKFFFFLEKKRLEKYLSFIFMCTSVSPVTRVTCSCEPCDVVLKSKCS